MSVITELIRQEQDGTISFGNYEATSKQKLADFEVEGDLYYIKTYNEITRVEKNGSLLLESIPGCTVHHFANVGLVVTFSLETYRDTTVTLELESDQEYKIFMDDEEVDKVKANLAGKVTFSTEAIKQSIQIQIEKI